MSVTATLNGNLQLTDNLSGSTTFLKQLLLSYAGTVSSFSQGLLVQPTPINIGIPYVTAQFVYVRNVSATAGANVTVSWTPNGGSLATVIVLSPGSAILFSETNQTNGIGALSLIATSANTPVEYILVS
jgi:hypothetical protein